MTYAIQENNFQVVVATNGTKSYAVFTYQCGQLNWVVGNGASIGFSASSTFFANHPLSQKNTVNDIACFNQQCPPWSNVVYQINKEPEGINNSVTAFLTIITVIIINFIII